MLHPVVKSLRMVNPTQAVIHMEMTLSSRLKVLLLGVKRSKRKCKRSISLLKKSSLRLWWKVKERYVLDGTWSSLSFQCTRHCLSLFSSVLILISSTCHFGRLLNLSLILFSSQILSFDSDLPILIQYQEKKSQISKWSQTDICSVSSSWLMWSQLFH